MILSKNSEKWLQIRKVNTHVTILQDKQKLFGILNWEELDILKYLGKFLQKAFICLGLYF